jgi:hypothetical protein
VPFGIRDAALAQGGDGFVELDLVPVHGVERCAAILLGLLEASVGIGKYRLRLEQVALYIGYRSFTLLVRASSHGRSQTRRFN